jgi:threonine dehydrogenase-like Zn-dependent dehydrogenase
VETAQIGIGDSVVVFGQGSMGLECLQIARNSGAGHCARANHSSVPDGLSAEGISVALVVAMVSGTRGI